MKPRIGVWDVSAAIGITILDLAQAHLVLLCCPLLCFTDTAVFYRLKVYDNSVSSKSVGDIFPTACAQFVSLSHILVILKLFETLKIILFISYVICD